VSFVGLVITILFFLNDAYCLNTDKLDLVKEILVHLSRGVENRPELQDDAFRLSPIPISHYLKSCTSNPVSFSPCCPVPDFLTSILGHRVSPPAVFFSVQRAGGNRRVSITWVAARPH
jgi:hypothetical protein